MDGLMSIKQKAKRRVTFHSIWQLGSSGEHVSRLKDDSAVNLDKILWTNKARSNMTLLTASDKSIEPKEVHINWTFKSDEGNDRCFLSAFGTKGKDVGEFEDIKCITCIKDEKILITDFVNSRLQIYNDLSKTVSVFSTKEMLLPWASAVTEENNIAVTLCKEKCVKIFNNDGDVIRSFGEDYFVRPTGISLDLEGNFIVCDSSTNKVSMFDGQGNFIRILGNPECKEECFDKPCYVCVSTTGDVIVSDRGHHKIKVFNSKGDFVRAFGSFGKRDKQLKSPYGVATNKFGDIFVADHYNSRISMFTRDGAFVRHIVTSDHGLVHPQGLTISPDLQMYVSHGHLKASEILAFKLTTDTNYKDSSSISHV